MATATDTRTRTAAAALAEDVATADTLTLAEAVAAVDIATGTAGGAQTSLFDIAQAEFAAVLEAHPLFVGDIAGTRVMRDNYAAEVRGYLWRAATGLSKPPAAADRTPGERYLAQCMSKFGTVAADFAAGVDALSLSGSDVRALYQGIKDGEKAGKDAESAADIARAQAEFDLFVSTELTPAAREAYELTRELFTAGVGAPHLASLIRDLTAALPAK